MHWARLADELAAFVLSASCAGCDSPATLLCDRCRADLGARLVRTTTPDGLPVVAALTYEGVAARCIRRVKEESQTILARPLGAALAVAANDLQSEHPAALPVPVPTGRRAFRQRGYRVPELLMRRAGLRPVRLLVQSRATQDQRELDLSQRRHNVARSMRARHARGDSEAVIFDDVITTGATLDEGARALRTAGIRVRGAVALALTPKRSTL